MINWMDCKQYSKHVGLSLHMIQALCKQQKITSVKVGVAWKIDADRADEDLIAMSGTGFRRHDVMPTLDEAKEKYLKEVV